MSTQVASRSLAILTLLMGIAPFASGDLITITRTNTPNIQIPRFNPSLGTLQSANINISFLSGTTTTSGSHDHASYQLSSTNTTAAQPTNFGTRTLGTATFGAHSHSFNSPFYAAAGINVGSFSGVTNTLGNHNHSITVSFVAAESTGSGFRLRVNVNPSPSGAHTHGYGTQNKVLNFSGPSLTPLIGGSDVFISAGGFSTSATGSHSHNVSSFNINTSTLPFGSETYNFAPSSLSFTGAHNHMIDPRFTVTANYVYAAIPEAAQWLQLLSVSAIGLAVYGVRRRRLAAATAA